MSKQQVSEEDKDRLYAFFILHLKSNKKDNTIDTCIKHIADKILNTNQVPTNEQEKLFIMNYVAKETLKEYGMEKKNVTIRLVDLGTNKGNGFLGGHEQNGFINMNSNINREPTFYNSQHQILQCVSHETVHRVQEIEAKQDPKKYSWYGNGFPGIIYG